MLASSDDDSDRIHTLTYGSRRTDALHATPVVAAATRSARAADRAATTALIRANEKISCHLTVTTADEALLVNKTFHTRIQLKQQVWGMREGVGAVFRL